MGPGTLEGILEKLPVFDCPQVLVGLNQPDDAVDFFTPVVDNPYLFGQIAATNALSDVYAMGGQPLTALNIVCFPTDCLDLEVLAQILAGGAEIVQRAGAVILGGHTVEDAEPKYGLAVTGIAHPERIITNQGARPGDLLVLTKPLGTGVIITAVKGEVLTEAEISPALASMLTLNQSASEAMQAWGVRGATDITGFGLLGHALEMAQASRCTIELWIDKIPWLPGAREMAGMGLVPAGAYANQHYLNGKLEFLGSLSEAEKDLLFDPQTSGGLLIAIAEAKVEGLVDHLKLRGETAWIIGRVCQPGDYSIRVHGV